MSGGGPGAPGAGAPGDAGRLAWLVDLQTLRRLPQRYSRAVDARDFDAVAALFHPDATVDGARGSMTAAAWVEGLRTSPRSFASSMHVLGDPLVELEPGADRASMDTYATVYQLRPAGAADGDLMLGMRYLDDLVRRGDGWVIHRRISTMLWNRTLPGA